MRMRTRAAVQVGNQLKDQLCLTLDVNSTGDTRLWHIFCELFNSCIIFWNDSIADESCRDCDCQKMCTKHTVQAKHGSRSRSESAKRQISTFILSKLKLSKLQAMHVIDCVNGICEKGGFDCLGKLNITLWQREASSSDIRVCCEHTEQSRPLCC